jgi:hypothetical protein
MQKKSVLKQNSLKCAAASSNIWKGYRKTPTRLIYSSYLASTDKQYQFGCQLLPERVILDFWSTIQQYKWKLTR